MLKGIFLCSLAFFSTAAFAADAKLELTSIVEKSLQYPASACILSNGEFTSDFERSKIEVFENSNKVDTEITAHGSQLCLNDLKHGSAYSVKIKKGFSDSKGQILNNEAVLNFDLPDAKENIFEIQGMILPPDGDKASINLETVNIKKIYIDIYTVGRNNLDDINFYALRGSDYDKKSVVNEHGSLLKKLEIKTAFKANEKISTKVSLNNDLKLKPGLYMLRVHNNKNGSENLERYVSLIISDLSLTALYGKDNIAILAKSFLKGTALDKVKVELRSKNNDLLESGTTDKNGFFAFKGQYDKNSRHAMRPEYISAFKGDYVYTLMLDSSELYLNEKYFKTKGAQHVYSYTDRGIYRPGETVHATVIIRDDNYRSHGADKLVVKVFNAHNLEVKRLLLTNVAPGAFEFDYTFDKKIRRGHHRFDISFDGVNTIDSLSVNVDDFIPPTVKITDPLGNDIIDIKKRQSLDLKSDFLYGKGAGNLRYLVSSSLIYDDNAIKGYSDYTFGTENTHAGFSQEDGFTGSDGIFTHKFTNITTTFPAMLKVHAEVTDTLNQRVSFDKNYHLETGRAYTGALKSNQGSQCAFDLVNVTRDGKFTDIEVDYTLERVKSFYHYVYANNGWDFREVTTKSFVSGGSLLLKDDKGQSDLTFTLDSGRYLLTLKDKKTAAILYQRDFYEGYNTSFADSRQNLLEISTDKKAYKEGDDVYLSFDSSFDGIASLILASDKILDVKNINIKKGINKIKIKAPDEARSDIYALLHATRAFVKDKGFIARKIGLVHIPYDFSDRVLDIKTSFDNDTVIKPLETFAFDVAVDKCQNCYLSAMLVDEAIVSMAGYKKVDIVKSLLSPLSFYYSVYDRYNFLMPDKVNDNQGYGDEAMSSLAAMPYKTTALSKKLVKVENGKARVEFDIPQFAGALRLSLVAFDDNNFGSKTTLIKVRDSAVVTPVLPRFLAPEDKTYLKLDIANIETNDDSFNINVKCTSPLVCDSSKSLQVKKDTRESVLFDLASDAIGVGSVDIEVTSKDFSYKDSLSLQVRKAYPEIQETLTHFVKAGEEAVFHLHNDFDKNADIKASLSTLPNVNVQSIADNLVRHDGFFVYDSIARAHALLYLKKAGRLDSFKQSADIKIKALYDEADNIIIDAIKTLEGLMRHDGMFSLADSRENNSFYSLLCLDFLTDAKEAGFSVNTNLLNIANACARDNYSYASLSEKALAFSVMSKYDRVNVADMRYIFDDSKCDDLLYHIYMAKAFLNTADKKRAKEACDRALILYPEYISLYDRLCTQPLSLKELADLKATLERYAPDDIASPYYIGYELLSLASILDEASDTQKLIEQLSAINQDAGFLSVTDQKAIILASVNSTGGIFYKKADFKGKNPYFIVNDSGTDLFATISAFGLSKNVPDEYEHKLGLKKYYFNSSFESIDDYSPLYLKEGDLIYVLLHSKLMALSFGGMVIEDMLPSGFEYETVDIYNKKIASKLPEKFKVYTAETSVQKSDDRIRLKSNMDYSNDVVYIYALRAVMPGTFVKGSASAFMHNAPFIRSFVKGDGSFVIKP